MRDISKELPNMDIGARAGILNVEKLAYVKWLHKHNACSAYLFGQKDPDSRKFHENFEAYSITDRND